MLGRILVRRGLITMDQLGDALAEQFGVPFVEVVPQAVNPQIVRRFIDSAVAGAPSPQLLQLAALFLLLALGQQGLVVANTYLAAHVGLLATNRLRADLALHCLSLDMAFHNARTPGEDSSL